MKRPQRRVESEGSGLDQRRSREHRERLIAAGDGEAGLSLEPLDARCQLGAGRSRQTLVPARGRRPPWRRRGSAGRRPFEEHGGRELVGIGLIRSANEVPPNVIEVAIENDAEQPHQFPNTCGPVRGRAMSNAVPRLFLDRVPPTDRFRGQRPDRRLRPSWSSTHSVWPPDLTLRTDGCIDEVRYRSGASNSDT